MKRLLLLLVMALGLAWPFASVTGQTRPGQRAKSAMKERREARMAGQLVEEGAKLLQQGKTRLAAEKFMQALKLEPENDRAHGYAAEIAWKEQRYELAQHHAELALRFNDQNARAHFVAGQLLMREGRALAAFDHLRKASQTVADEKEKRETGKLLSQLRDKHPEWFSRTRAVTDPKPVESKPAPALPKNVSNGVRPNLAIFTFAETNPEKPKQGWGESLAEMLTTALINSGSYRIIERTQLHKVLEEQALGQSGALDSETAVAVGKIMGIDAVVVGSISELNRVLESDARILNVETGEAIAAAHARGASPDDLRQMAEVLAKDIGMHAATVPVHAQDDSISSSKKF